MEPSETTSAGGISFKKIIKQPLSFSLSLPFSQRKKFFEEIKKIRRFYGANLTFTQVVLNTKMYC